MQNFTDLPQKFVHRLSVVDAPAGAVDLPNPILSVKGEVNGVIAYVLEGDEIKATKSSYALDWATSSEIGPDQRATFASTTQHVLPIDWEDAFILAEPTIGVRVYVEAPPEIVVNVIFDHRLGQDVKPASDGAWLLNEAFLPNTLFRTAWKLRNVASTNQVAKQSELASSSATTVPASSAD